TRIWPHAHSLPAPPARGAAGPAPPLHPARPPGSPGPWYGGKAAAVARTLGADAGAGRRRGQAPDARRPRLTVATSAALTAATCGVLTGFVSSRPTGLGRHSEASGAVPGRQGANVTCFFAPQRDEPLARTQD